MKRFFRPFATVLLIASTLLAQGLLAQSTTGSPSTGAQAQTCASPQGRRRRRGPAYSKKNAPEETGSITNPP